jgi:hypothetical protein
MIHDVVGQRLVEEVHQTNVLEYANHMHTLAEKLSATIRPGQGGLVHVQQLFLTAFWFKSAERWKESWHALGGAVLEAVEIGRFFSTLSRT